MKTFAALLCVLLLAGCASGFGTKIDHRSPAAYIRAEHHAPHSVHSAQNAPMKSITAEPAPVTVAPIAPVKKPSLWQRIRSHVHMPHLHHKKAAQ